MPVVQPTQAPVEALSYTAVKIATDDYQTSVVDVSRYPVASLLTYAEGSRWVTKYYSQVIGSSDELSPQQVALGAAYQQYTCIVGLVMKVTTPLQGAQEQEDRNFNITGAATAYPFVIPNVGDMFLADVGDGREGLFTVTVAEKKTILKETTYQIEYVLVAVQDVQRVKDLNAKVIKTVYYQEDFAAYGQNPLLVESQVQDRTSIAALRKQLIAEYIGQFYNHQFKTLVVPEQLLPTYDPNVTKLWLSIVDTIEHPRIRHIKSLNCDGTTNPDIPNVVDALVLLDDTYLFGAPRQAMLVTTSWFNRIPMLEHVLFSGIDYLVFPFPSADYVIDSTAAPVATGPLLRAPPVTATPTEYRVNTTDGVYWFSEAFYDGASDGSTLEVLLRRALRSEAITYAEINTVYTALRTAQPLDRYYYLPIVLILLSYALAKL